MTGMLLQVTQTTTKKLVLKTSFFVACHTQFLGQKLENPVWDPQYLIVEKLEQKISANFHVQSDDAHSLIFVCVIFGPDKVLLRGPLKTWIRN